jgi:hypothetical protein
MEGRKRGRERKKEVKMKELGEEAERMEKARRKEADRDGFPIILIKL